jgi:nicotinamide mononucleotide transporter
MHYLIENWVEIVGSILSFIYLYLSIKRRISLWIFGFLCSALYAVVFFQSQFYAGMTLQFYYLFISVYGWINWRRGKENGEKELPISRVPKRTILYLTPTSLLIFAGYYFIHAQTDSSAVVAVGDSFITALSIVATWMLAKKYIEYWLVFMVVNPISASLFFYQGLYPTAILFLVYGVMAVVGYTQWKKSFKPRFYQD